MSSKASKTKTLKEYYDKIAEHCSGFYNKPGSLAEKFQNRVLRIVIKMLRSHDKLLDVGCGRGRYFIPLRRAGFMCVGLDVSLGMLKIARNYVNKKEKSDFSLIQCTAELLPFVNASFGSAICIDLLHHLPNKSSREQVIRELARVVKSDGQIVLEIKNRMNIIYWLLSKCSPSPVAETVSISEPIFLLKTLGFNMIETKGVMGPISILSPLVLIIASRHRRHIVHEKEVC